MHSFISIFFLVHIVATLLFLIIVGVFAGIGPYVEGSPKDGAAVAFAVLDFLVCSGMLVWTFIGNRNESGGGFSEPPVTHV